MTPRLQRILESPPPTGPSEELAFIGAVMDALIQSNARVPAPVLVRYIEKRPVHAFVLLSRATDREAVVLEMLPRLSGIQWFAAANILFEDRSPGLVDYLAGTVRLRLTVHVADNENAAFGVGSPAGVGVGCGIAQAPPAYPPHAEYRFELGPHAGVIVLAPGPRTVWYSHTVTTDFQYVVSELSIGGPTDADGVEYLQAMWPEGGLPFRAHTVETVAWSTADALSRRVRALRSVVEARFQSLVDRARRSRSMSPGVVMPPIEVDVVVPRSDKAVPLPKFDP